MLIKWGPQAEIDFQVWQKKNKKITQKIKNLIRDIKRSPYTGLGRPKALKYKLSGFYARRINEKHRLIYMILDSTLFIESCKGHYD